MDTEKTKTKVSLVTTVLACVGTFLGSIGGTVAWATQFQTKVKAAETEKVQAARLDAQDKRQYDIEISHAALRQDVTDVRETVHSVDEKLDRLLLRGRR